VILSLLHHQKNLLIRLIFGAILGKMRFKRTGKVDDDMMYPYITLADETEIVHSHVMEVNGVQTVEVHFERPSEDHGFDSARCVLPSYQWKFNEGFSEADIRFFDEFLHHNAHLLYRYAAQGGVHCA